MRSYKGIFKLKNKDKYVGNSDFVVYRSGLELKFFNWLDRHPNIIQWSSEELKISYFNPLDNKWHYYYPDILMKIKKGDNIEIIMVEVKPENQTTPPKPAKEKTRKSEKRLLKEQLEFTKNSLKWEAARHYCQKKGWKFQIITEKNILGENGYGR